MKLRKDDPIYYRNEIKNLLKQAHENGLQIEGYWNDDSLRIGFRADNGDFAVVTIEKQAKED